MQVKLFLEEVPQEDGSFEEVLDWNACFGHLVMLERSQGCCYDCLLEENMSESVSIIGEGEEFHK